MEQYGEAGCLGYSYKRNLSWNRKPDRRFSNPCHLFCLDDRRCWFTFPPWDLTSVKEKMNYVDTLRSAEFLNALCEWCKNAKLETLQMMNLCLFPCVGYVPGVYKNKVLMQWFAISLQTDNTITNKCFCLSYQKLNILGFFSPLHWNFNALLETRCSYFDNETFKVLWKSCV